MSLEADEKKTLFEEMMDFFVKHATDNVKKISNFKDVLEYKYKPKKGVTETEVVFRDNKMRLLRYKSDKPKKYRVPLLFVYSVINRWYIVDLMENRSLMKFLVDQGYDVYITDWGVPTRSDKDDGFNEYICGYLNSAIDYIRESTKSDKVTIYGYCLGGTFTILYSALFPEKIKNLICMTAPVDFSTDGLFKRWSDKETFDSERIIETTKLFPAGFMDGALGIKNVAASFWKGHTFFQNLKSEKFLTNFFALEGWLNDSVPMAGRLYVEVIKELYQNNALVKDELKIGERTVNLKDINSSILNIIGTKDNIVPPASSLCLSEHVSSKDKHDLILNAGHNGIVVGGIAARKLWPGVNEWLAPRSEEIK